MINLIISAFTPAFIKYDKINVHAHAVPWLAVSSRTGIDNNKTDIGSRHLYEATSDYYYNLALVKQMHPNTHKHIQYTWIFICTTFCFSCIRFIWIKLPVYKYKTFWSYILYLLFPQIFMRSFRWNMQKYSQFSSCKCVHYYKTKDYLVERETNAYWNNYVKPRFVCVLQGRI